MTQAEPPINDLVPYSAKLEEPKPEEEASIKKIIADLHKNSELQFNKRKKKRKEPHAIRDAHAKAHGILAGTLTVRADLPDHLRQGMFAEPGKTYEVIARISSTSGAIRTDRVRGVRGMGLKVLGVEGDRVDPLFPEKNQDFVFVTEPEFLFTDALDYSKSGMLTAKALAHTPDAAMIVLNTVLRGVRRILAKFDKDLIPKLKVFADPNYNVLGQSFYTAAPIRYGDYVAKISVAPSSESVAVLKGATVKPGKEALTDAVTQFFRTNSAEYVVSAQLCKAGMPIEDAEACRGRLMPLRTCPSRRSRTPPRTRTENNGKSSATT